MIDARVRTKSPLEPSNGRSSARVDASPRAFAGPVPGRASAALGGFVALALASGCWFNPPDAEGPITSATVESVSSTTLVTGEATTDATTEGPTAVCGDGIVDTGEACDDGNKENRDACTNACLPAACGDGITQLGVEACDDGAKEPGDWCAKDCSEETVIVEIAVGVRHTCVRFESGGVRCWGSGIGNGSGDFANDLGDAPGEMPPPTLDLGDPASRIAAGHGFTCALLSEGQRLRCWGSGEYGQLGLGDVVDQPTPPMIDVPLGPLEVIHGIAISAGPHHACVLQSGALNPIRCWGRNESGQLCRGHTMNIGDDPGELPPPESYSDGARIAAGVRHTCAIKSDGKLYCCGAGNSGALGKGDVGTYGDEPGENNPPVSGLFTGSLVKVAAGNDHTCVLTANGNVYCVGDNQYGQLGLGHSDDVGASPDDTPMPVALAGAASEIAVGYNFACALISTGEVQCWGRGESGSLGSGDTLNLGDDPDDFPLPIVDLGRKATHVSAHPYGLSVCASLDDGTLRCWGDNFYGQLGYGHKKTIGDDEAPRDAGRVPF